PDLVEQLLDEVVLVLLTAGGEFGQVTSADKANALALLCDVIGDRVNGAVILLGPKSPHGVILFQAEAEWVDDRMAGLAGLRSGEFGHLFAHGQVGREISVLERHRHGWRP